MKHNKKIRKILAIVVSFVLGVVAYAQYEDINKNNDESYSLDRVTPTDCIMTNNFDSACSNLYDLNPDILIFIGLRHPLSLFKSYYTHCLRKNYIGENYCQVDFFMNFYLNDLSYKKNYKKWSDKFKNIHYYDFDKIKSAPNYLIDQITLKIGDDIFVNKSNLNKTVNQGSLPKFKFVERSRVFVFNLLREYKFLLNVLIKLFRIIKPLLFSIRKMNKINLDEKVILLLSDEIIFYKKLLDDK